MGDWPLVDGQGATFVQSAMVTTGAADTYGSWVEQTSALPYDVGALRCWPAMQGANLNYVVQYGIGTAGSEVGVVEIPCLQEASATSPQIEVPISLPRGVRLAVRAKCGTGAQTMYPDQLLLPVGSLLGTTPLQRSTLYGVTGSVGTSVSSGATQNYGSWTQITASTSSPMRQMVVCVQGNTTTEVLLQAQLAIGAGGSEQVLIDKHYWYVQSGSKRVTPASQNFNVNIPSGTRVAMRMIAPNLAGTHTVNFSIIGLD